MTGSIIGIDIGSQGAIALLTPAGVLLEVVDMPPLRATVRMGARTSTRRSWRPSYSKCGLP